MHIAYPIYQIVCMFNQNGDYNGWRISHMPDINHVLNVRSIKDLIKIISHLIEHFGAVMFNVATCIYWT